MNKFLHFLSLVFIIGLYYVGFVRDPLPPDKSIENVYYLLNRSDELVKVNMFFFDTYNQNNSRYHFETQDVIPGGDVYFSTPQYPSADEHFVFVDLYLGEEKIDTLSLDKYGKTDSLEVVDDPLRIIHVNADLSFE